MSNGSTAKRSGGMDDILSSIRRIIDESEQRARAKVAAAPVPNPANDQAKQARANIPAISERRKDPEPMPKDDIEVNPEVDAVLARLDADISADLDQSATLEHVPGDLEIDHDLVEPAISAKRQLSSAESATFAHVGNVLNARMPEAATASESSQSLQTLVSIEAAQSISASFAALEKAYERGSGESLAASAETMLKPMLQDWLDNNLPQLVERLVRAEIERVARGEPRKG